MGDHGFDDRVPLEEAEVRLRQARNYLRIVEPLLDAELSTGDDHLTRLLAEVIGQRDPHPRYGDLGILAAGVKHDRLDEARVQLPRVLFNSLLVYAVSMTEAVLEDAIETVERLTLKRPPEIRERSPYLRRLRQLEAQGLEPDLPAGLAEEMKDLRRRRNAVVHERETVESTEIAAAFDLVENLLVGLRNALIVLEEDLDPRSGSWEGRRAGFRRP
jgi:hypothetical protein